VKLHWIGVRIRLFKKNVFFISLQRTGSNYLEIVLNKNTPSDVSFRGYLLEDGNAMSKHCFPKHINYLKKAKIAQAYFVLVVRNPYLWAESLLFNDRMNSDVRESLWWGFEEYELEKNPDVGNSRYNLENLIKLYKDFYSKWLKYSDSNTDIQLVRYEDFLDEKKAEEVSRNIISKIGGDKVVKDFKLHYGNVRYSKYFDKNDFNYNKKEIPKKLSSNNINKITELLGSDLIQSLGYKCYG
jgi:hypothetical protein